MAINLSIEYLFKNISLDIILSPEKKNPDEIIKDLCKEVSSLKIENKELKNKIEKQNQEINNLKININYLMNKSMIMKEDERNFIFTKIESNMCKKIKEIKKLYQATIDGGDSINHKKSDNIPNTLVLIKSDGQRRFGGFTPIPWISEENL